MANVTSTGVVKIPLTQGLVALVDQADAQILNQFKWCATRRGATWYAVRGTYLPDGRRTLMYMHTAITGYHRTDHVNGDGLDNRRCNLRAVTQAENMKNTRRPSNNSSGFKGVCWDRKRRIWRAYIKVSGHQRHLGYFPNPIDAAIAYDRAARRDFGEYAAVNFPDPGERAA